MGTALVLWLPATLMIAALVFSPAVPEDTASCDRTAPGNCSFHDTFCNWSKSHWSHYSGYTYLSRNKLSGSLTSGNVCANSSVSHCLKFKYYLEKKRHDNNMYTLNVSISHQSNNSKKLLWENSTKTSLWQDAEISVKTNSNFNLVIEGTRSKGNKCIRIKKLIYEKRSCSNEPTTVTTVSSTRRTHVPTTSESTSTAASPTSSPTATTAASSKFTSHLPPSTDSNTASDGSHTTTQSASPVTFSTIPSTKNMSVGGLGDSPSSANSTGVIVGVIVAVILIACLVIVLLFLLRRKELLCWKVQSKDSDTLQCSGSVKKKACDDFGDVAAGDHNYTELDVPNISSPDRYSSLCEARTSRASMENYSTVRDVGKDDSSTPEPGDTLYDLAKPVPLSTSNGLDNPRCKSSLDDL